MCKAHTRISGQGFFLETTGRSRFWIRSLDSGWNTQIRLKCLQFFPRFEANRLARGNGNLSTRSWISANAGFSGPHVEDTETSQLNPVAVRQSFLHALKDCFNSHLGFCLCYSGAVHYLINNVQLYQGSSKRSNLHPLSEMPSNVNDMKAFSNMSMSDTGRDRVSQVGANFLPLPEAGR